VGTEGYTRRFMGHTSRVTALAFSSDGKRALSGGEDNTIRLGDARTGKECRRFEGHTGTVLGVAFGLNGKLILSGGQDGTMRLWDRQTGKEVCQFKGHMGGIHDVAISPEPQVGRVPRASDRQVIVAPPPASSA
jgi:hypothetical protein